MITAPETNKKLGNIFSELFRAFAVKLFLTFAPRSANIFFAVRNPGV